MRWVLVHPCGIVDNQMSLWIMLGRSVYPLRQRIEFRIFVRPTIRSRFFRPFI